MRTSITIFALMIIMNTLSYGQTEKFDAPKKTNTIVLIKEGNATLILTEFAQHLQDNGYTIEKLDRELLSLSTDFRDYKFAGKAVMKIIVFVRQMDTKVKIEIKGKIEISNPFGGQVPYDVCNCGMAGDARKNAFKAILKLIETYSFESIEFIEK